MDLWLTPLESVLNAYRPKPEARIHLAQVTPEIHADPLFFIENMPDSDVEDRESGEHSEDEADSDDDIEEAVNAVVERLVFTSLKLMNYPLWNGIVVC